jgi:hypothetical protein
MTERAVRRKEEPEYERLIRMIQNREGRPIPKADREAACLQVMEQFKYLIKRIASQTWRRDSGETRGDWHHETLTTFFELMVGDYTPHAQGGAAMFAPYIKQKLYYKMLYRSQRALQQQSRERASAFDVDLPYPSYVTHGVRTHTEGPLMTRELREAILANSAGIEETIIGEMRDSEIEAQLDEIKAIADAVLDERSKTIWHQFFYTPTLVKVIGEQLEPRISTSRVNQLINSARTRVLEELGRRRVAAALAH